MQVLREGPFDLQGRSIDPQRAKRGGGGRSDGIKKVYVGGVESHVSEDEIRDYFSSFGRVSFFTCAVDTIFCRDGSLIIYVAAML